MKKQSKYARLLRAACLVLGAGVAAAAIWIAAAPGAVGLTAENTLPVCVLGALLAVPLLCALGFGVRMFANIEKDRSFTRENGRLLRRIAVCALVDAALAVAAGWTFFAAGWGGLALALALTAAALAGGMIALASAALSELVMKAAELQEMNDATV